MLFWFPAQGPQTQCVDKRAIPGASCSCHQTQRAWPQLVASLKKKMLTQSKEYFSTMPVNLSARSIEQQAYKVDQRWFALRLITRCLRVPVNITSIPALPSSVQPAEWRLSIFNISSNLILEPFSNPTGDKFGSSRKWILITYLLTELQASLTLCLPCPDVWWDSVD